MSKATVPFEPRRLIPLGESEPRQPVKRKRKPVPHQLRKRPVRTQSEGLSREDSLPNNGAERVRGTNIPQKGLWGFCFLIERFLHLDAISEPIPSFIEKSRAVSILSEGRLQSVSQDLLEATGWSEQELIGKHFFCLLHTEELGRVQRLYEKALYGASVQLGTLKCKAKDGTYVEVNSSFEPRIMEQGNIGGVLWLSHSNKCADRTVTLSH